MTIEDALTRADTLLLALENIATHEHPSLQHAMRRHAIAQALLAVDHTATKRAIIETSQRSLDIVDRVFGRTP